MMRRESIILILILAAAAFLRFYDLTRTSLWMDEIWSIEIASGRSHQHAEMSDGAIREDQVELTSLKDMPPWYRLWSPATDYTYPPLYPVVLRFWMDLFGNSAGAIRSLSAIFSVAVVAVFFDLLRVLHGNKIALLGAAIMTVAGAQLDCAQEARCYAMLLLVAIGCADALVRIEKLGASGKRLIALAVLLLVGLFTHYLIAGVAGAFVLYILIRLRGRDRAKACTAIFVTVLVFVAVWGYAVIWQAHHLPGPTPGFLRESRGDQHFELTLRRVAGLPGEYLCGEATADRIFQQQSPITQLLTIGLLAVAVMTLLAPWARLRRRPDLLLWMLWIGGTIGLIAAADLAMQTTMSGYIRYTILAAPCVYAIITAWNWPNRNVMRHGLALIVIAALIVLAARRASIGPVQNENWRQAAMELDSSGQKDDLIVFFNQDPWVAPGMWYVCLRYYSPESNRPWVLLTDQPDADLLRQISQRNSLWVVAVDAQETGELLLPGWRVSRVIPVSENVSICQMTR
jgi:hypothetical protein